MKVIERLNKIANNEISAYDKFKYENKIVNMEYLIDNCLFFSILNDEVEVLEDETLEEKKKIPKKLNKLFYREDYATQDACIDDIIRQFNNLIDYLKSKGDE